MKRIFSFTLFSIIAIPFLIGQGNGANDKNKQAIISLIDQYSLARDNQDTTLLKRILTDDVDQLVSSGEWRVGIRESVKGMLASSSSNPGSRKLIVDKIRFINKETGIADARYEIRNSDGSIRKMWSTFIVWNQNGDWKITGIRNMLPSTAR